MRRRTLLAHAAGGVLVGLAGCVDPLGRGGERTEAGQSPTAGAGATATPAGAARVDAVAGADLPVPRSELTRSTERDAIPAITDPAFADDWAALDVGRLRPDDEVVGVVRGGEARAYPLRVLNWHEVVNDALGGSLLVTYCPLCASAITAGRTVDGEPTRFGVAGLLWRSNLVMYDAATGSHWSQLAATAIRGPATGRQLSLVPSRLTTWATWRRTHPETRVLLPPPASETVRGAVVGNYDLDPYNVYAGSDHVGVEGKVPVAAGDLHPKTRVLGVAAGDAARAYPLPAVRSAGFVNDAVGDIPVVVTVGADGTTLAAYDRRIDGRAQRFERASQTHLRAAGSRWRIATGRAVDGPHEGTTLASPPTVRYSFWFAWLEFHPETTRYRPPS